MTVPEFCGTDYEPTRDRERLSSQHVRVKIAALSWPGGWFTMGDLAEYVDEPAASTERQIRYLRGAKFGAYQVQKRHLSRGLFQYRVLTPGQRELF